MIAPSDLTGIDADLARRIIATARSIAPCLDTLVDEPRLDAIAILRGVASEGAARGSRLIKSQSVITARVEYNPGTWWSDDDRGALRALCSATSSDSAGHPVGSFPKTSRVVARMWPEDC